MSAVNHIVCALSFVLCAYGAALGQSDTESVGAEWQLQPVLDNRDQLRTIHCIAWSPDSTVIATGGADFTVAVHRGTDFTQTEVLGGQKSSVYATDFVNKGNLLATGGYDTDLFLWDVQNRTVLILHNEAVGEVYAMCALSSDHIAVAGKMGRLVVWDVARQAVVNTLTLQSPVTSIGFSPIAHVVACATPSPECAGMPLFSWDGEKMIAKGRLPASTGNHSVVTAGGCGRVMATAGSGESGIMIWDLTTGEHKSKLRGHSVSTTSLCFDPSGSHLASTGQDAIVRVWNCVTSALVTSAEPFTSGVGRQVSFSPDGRFLAAVGGEEPRQSHLNRPQYCQGLDKGKAPA